MILFGISFATGIFIGASVRYLVSTSKIDSEIKFTEKLRIEKLNMRYGYDPLKVQQHLIKEQLSGKIID